MEKQLPPAPAELKLVNKKSSKERSSSRSLSNEEKPSKDKKEKLDINGNSVQGRWHKSEHDRFIEAIKKFGKDWKSVEQYIETRSGSQIRSHAQKFFNRIIKKYEIDKTEVINFIQNSYDSEQSSTSATPQKKKKTDKDGETTVPQDYKPILPLMKKQDSNYENKTKNESPRQPGTTKKGAENGHGGKDQDLTHSLSNDMSIQSANDEQNEHRRPIMGIVILCSLEQPNEYTTESSADLRRRTKCREYEYSDLEISGVQRMTYATFLTNFTKKIEQVKHLDINYGYRANGAGDEYYNGYYGR